MSHRETGVTNIPKTGSVKAASTEVSIEERHQLIAEAAYFHAEKRSFAPGQEMEDWLKAEAEIEMRFSQIGMSDLHRNI